MASAAGFLPATRLRTVAPGTRLLNPVAVAFTNLVMIGWMLDRTEIRPAGTFGAGYRDWSTAMVFWRAGRGDPDARRQAGIDPHLQVSIAYPPGSHGTGDRIDMLFTHGPTDHNLDLARRYGFVREFGRADTNHFKHDQRTAISGVRGVDKLRLLGRFYNGLHLGRQTDAASTGRRDADLIWLAQQHGHVQATYPPASRVDGLTGPNTEHAMDVEWARLKSAYHRERG